MTAAWCPKRKSRGANRIWTPEDRARLMRMEGRGVSRRVIAQTLDRSPKSVSGRIEIERRIERGEEPRAPRRMRDPNPLEKSERPEWSSDGRPRIGRRDPLLEALTTHHRIEEIVNAL